MLVSRYAPLPMRRILCTCLLVLPLFGCAKGGAAAPAESPAVAEPAATSGGEATPTEPERVVITPGDTPIPVPRTGVSRDAMSEPAQLVYRQVEEAIAIRPPEPPTQGTLEAVNAWAEGPFRVFLEHRLAATQAALDTMARMTQSPVTERGMGAALLGYLYEDMVASIRGSAVPEDIAHDPELLDAYRGALSAAVGPLAGYAANAYQGCVSLFGQAADPAWAEWSPYCTVHLEDVEEAFGVTPTSQGSSTSPAPRAP